MVYLILPVTSGNGLAVPTSLIPIVLPTAAKTYGQVQYGELGVGVTIPRPKS